MCVHFVNEGVVMSYEKVARVVGTAWPDGFDHFGAEVVSPKRLKNGAELYAWRPETVREIYEQAERDYHRHNPTLDGQS